MCLSIMNIHVARRTGRRRQHKGCMGWSWAAACGVQGGGILHGFPHSLLPGAYSSALCERKGFGIRWKNWGLFL